MYVLEDVICINVFGMIVNGCDCKGLYFEIVVGFMFFYFLYVKSD